MKREPVDESKLVQMYYIQRAWYSENVSFSIVYGTLGAKTFTGVRRDDIVGRTNDVRIDLDHSRLFKDFGTAAQAFKSLSLEMKERCLETISDINAGLSKVDELLTSLGDI